MLQIKGIKMSTSAVRTLAEDEAIKHIGMGTTDGSYGIHRGNQKQDEEDGRYYLEQRRFQEQACVCDHTESRYLGTEEWKEILKHIIKGSCRKEISMRGG